MSKFRAKVAEWLLNLADKMDGKTVKDKMVYPAAQMYFPDPKPIILYDGHNIDKIQARHVVTDEQMRYAGDLDMDKFVAIKLTEGIASEIMKLKKDEIEKKEMYEPYGKSTMYLLDVYVCKPRKESY